MKLVSRKFPHVRSREQWVRYFLLVYFVANFCQGTSDIASVSCEKGLASRIDAERRLAEVQKALFFRPHPEDWRDIRWSNEAHFRRTRHGRIQIIRKRGERYCPDCIHHAEMGDDDEPRQRYHICGAVRCGFKSELVFYEVPLNSNGKMSLQIYRDVILDGEVARWLARGDQFVPKEDGCSGHGGGISKRRNIVKIWKEEHSLKHFFNMSSSPDSIAN